MPVAFDNAGAFGTNTAAGSNAVTLTIGADPNRAAACFVYTAVAVPTDLAVSGAGAIWSLVTSITGTPNGRTTFVALFACAKPISGSQTVTASWSNGTMRCDMCVLTAASVDQNTPMVNGVSQIVPDGQRFDAITVATAIGDMCVDACASLDAVSGIAGGDATQIFRVKSRTIFGSSSDSVGSGTSAVMRWDSGASSSHLDAHLAANFLAFKTPTSGMQSSMVVPIITVQQW